MSRTHPRTSTRLFLLLLFTLACRAGAPRATPTSSPTTAPGTATLAPTATGATAATAQVPLAPATTDADQIDTTLAAMEAAVLARDAAAYFEHVDQRDPVFALEHTRWADEWARAPLLAAYTLTLDDLQVHDDTATAQLTVTWRTLTADETSTARFPVTFTRTAESAWRYAGELWEDQPAEHFLIRAQPGLDEAAARVSAVLPDVYAHVTRSLAYTPTAAMQLKLYGSVEALVANTLLSLPPIHGWNEPGESLKLYAGPGGTPEAAVAHEFTHFLEFEQAGTARSRLPWWLSEGLAAYVANDFAPSGGQAAQLDLVAEWSADGSLADWDTLSVFETTPPELWRFVYPQGYAFVTFVTEVYGVEQRNAWLKAMSTEMDLSAATAAVLGRSFEALDEEFRAWLAAR